VCSVPALTPAISAVISTLSSAWRFHTVRLPCSASTPNPRGRSALPRTSAARMVSPSMLTCPARTASSAMIATCPTVVTLVSVSVPQSDWPVSA
jgi:hypothetical protein